MELGLVLEMAAGADPERVAASDVDGTPLTTGALQALARAAAAKFTALGATQVGYLAGNGRALAGGTVRCRARWGCPSYRSTTASPTSSSATSCAATPAWWSSPTRPAVAACTISASPTPVSSLAAISSAPTDGAPAELAPVDPDEVAVLLYTSGTTAAPKAAVLRHRHLASYVIGTVEFVGGRTTTRRRS